MKTIATRISPNTQSGLLCLLTRNNRIVEPTQKESVAHLLIVDANTFRRSNRPLVRMVRRYLANGAAVTILDPGEEQKALVLEICNMSVEADSVSRSAWTIKALDGYRTGTAWLSLILEDHLIVESVPGSEDPCRPSTGEKRCVRSTKEIPYSQVVDYYQLVDKALGGELPVQNEQNQTPVGLEQNYQHHVISANWTAAGGSYKGNSFPSQAMTLTRTFDVYVFLNDGGDGTPYQKVAFNEQCVFGPQGGMGTNNGDNVGWFGANCAINHSAPDFSIYSASPTTPNNATTVTSSTSFSVGFSGLSGAGSYGYSKSTSETITDWYVTEKNISNTEVQWNFYQTSPWSIQDPTTVSRSAFTEADPFHWHPLAPSDLSQTSITMAPQSAWTNNAAQSSVSLTASAAAYAQFDMTKNGFWPGDQWYAMNYNYYTPSYTFSFTNLPTTKTPGYTVALPSTLNSTVATSWGFEVYATIANNTSEDLTMIGIDQWGDFALPGVNGAAVVIKSKEQYSYGGYDGLLAFINSSFECVALIQIIPLGTIGTQDNPVVIPLETASLPAPASVLPTNQQIYEYVGNDLSSVPNLPDPPAGSESVAIQPVNLQSSAVKFYQVSGGQMVAPPGLQQAPEIDGDITPGNGSNQYPYPYAYATQVGRYFVAVDANNPKTGAGIYKITGYASPMVSHIYIDPGLAGQPTGS